MQSDSRLPTAANSAGSDGFKYEINALRAFAVLAVLAFHFKLPGFSGGFAGVDVFFVISGFLISSQILDALERGNFSYLRFYNARLRRIVPALLVVCLVCLVWGWFFYLPRDYIMLNRHVLSSLAFVSNLVFNGEKGYFDAAADTKALLHTWSLSVEAQFYVFLPILLTAAMRLGRSGPTAVISIATVAFLGWSVYIGVTAPGQGFYLLSCRTGEFLVGVTVALLRYRRIPDRLGGALALLSLAALLASFVLIDSSMAWPGYWTLLPVFATAMLLACGAAPLVRPLMAAWPLQRTGDISYSLYLWHWPVWVFANQLASMYGRDIQVAHITLMLLLSFALAFLSWRYVEQPVRHRNGWWTGRRVALGALLGLLTSLVFGFLVVINKGVPSRLPSYVQRASIATDVRTPRNECFRRPDGGKDAADRFCVFGHAGAAPPSAILWGDSHANQYAAALSDAASSLELSGLIATQGGCRPRLVSAPDAASSACQRFNREVYLYLQEQVALRTVIIGQHWSESEPVSELIALVRDILAMGRKVILVGPLPKPGFDVPERWAKQQIRMGQAMDSMVLPLSSQIISQQIRAQLMDELAEPLRTGQLVLVDPLKGMCDLGDCRLVENGRSNFRDESHLSQAGSMDFTPDFLDALSRLQRAR